MTSQKTLGTNLILIRNGYSSHAAIIPRSSHHKQHNCSYGGYLKQEPPFLHNVAMHSLHCGTTLTGITRHHNQNKSRTKVKTSSQTNHSQGHDIRNSSKKSSDKSR
jgi:hypothetical protein